MPRHFFFMRCRLRLYADSQLSFRHLLIRPEILLLIIAISLSIDIFADCHYADDFAAFSLRRFRDY
jgi:hypothetical protein